MVSVLCLISSYFYCSILCYRYTLPDDHHDSKTVTLVITFEIIFLIHCGLKFLVDFNVDGSKIPVGDIAKISTHYLNTGFWADFIPIVPFQFIPMYRNRQYLFYIIKLYRITKGLQLYNVQTIMDAVKTYWGKVVLE